MGDSVNFICGCSGFLPLQNELFLEVVREHFIERLKDPEFYALCEKRYPVRDEVAPILEAAAKYSRSNDVRIWTVVGKHRLRESNWLDLEFEDVTNNVVRRRERLESPLRSVLTKLYTNSSSSKTTRYPNPKLSSDSGSQQGMSLPPLMQQQGRRPSHEPNSLSMPSQADQLSRQQSLGSASYAASPSLPQMQQQSFGSTNASYITAPPLQQQLQSQGSYAAVPAVQQSRQRSHEEMMDSDHSQSVMLGQWGKLDQISEHQQIQLEQQPSHIGTTPTLPETDRSWELKGELSGLILYESAFLTEISDNLNRPSTYVASLSSVMDEQMDDQANTVLAKKAAKQWLDERPDSRWVCWIDASDPMSITDSYRKMMRHLCSQDSFEQQAPKRGRLDVSSAANEFLDEFRNRFSSKFECLMVYVNVTHPDIFVDGFLPGYWLHDMHCQSTIRGILLSTPHPIYQGNMGSPFGTVVQHSIEWIPHWSQSENRFWWERLPQSNLPPLLDDVDEPPEIDRKLAMDGRAVVLVEPGRERPDRAADVANQFARKWEMTENTERFSVWLKASDDSSLRESYRQAIRRVTHSVPQQPMGNPIDLSVRVIGDELMSILMKVREMSPSKQWIMVFADGNNNETPFYEKFFSGKSNWWNSKGRFVITSTSDDIEVEVVTDSLAYRKKVATIICR